MVREESISYLKSFYKQVNPPYVMVKSILERVPENYNLLSKIDMLDEVDVSVQQMLVLAILVTHRPDLLLESYQKITM